MSVSPQGLLGAWTDGDPSGLFGSDFSPDMGAAADAGVDPNAYAAMQATAPMLAGSGSPQGAPGPQGPQMSMQQPSLIQRILAGAGHGINRVASGMGDIMGGPSDPRLSVAANADARRQAITRAGLAMMAASGPSPVRHTLSEIFASGADAGQATGANVRNDTFNKASQAQAKQRLIDAIGNGTMDEATLKKMMAESIMSGDHASAQAIGEVLQKMIEHRNGTGGELKEVIGPDGKPVWRPVDKNTGRDLTTGEPAKIYEKPADKSLSQAIFAATQQQRQVENNRKLAEEWDKAHKDIEGQHDALKHALESADSALSGNTPDHGATAQQAMLFGFEKLLNPTGVVRPGTIRLSQEGQPLYQKAVAAFKNIAGGHASALTPQQVLAIKQLFQKAIKDKEQASQELHDSMTKRAGYYGADAGVLGQPLAPTNFTPPANGTFGDLIPKK